MGSSPVVLHLIDSLAIGGAQTRLLNDLRYLDGAFTHRVYTLFPRASDQADALEALRIPLQSLRLKRLSELPRGIRRLARVVRSDPGIQLIHTQLFCADIVGRLAGRLARCPVISTVQSAVYEPDSELNSSWRRWLDRWTTPWSEHFVAVSGFVRESLHRRLGVPLGKISVIPNSVDVQRVMPDPLRRKTAREQLRLAEEDFAWITVGRLNPPKGYRYLLEAMAQVVRQLSRVRLLVVGDGPSRTPLEQVARAAGLANAIQFLGERRDVLALLDAADAFVFPSLSEGLPLALLEAMAMGKPCVASRIAPHQEMIEHGHSGLLVAARDPLGLAEAMHQVQSDTLWSRKLGEEARAAARRFDAVSCAAALRQLYETVIPDQRR